MKRAAFWAAVTLYILWINITTFFLRPMTWTILGSKQTGSMTDYVLECLSHFLLFLLTLTVIALSFKAKDKTRSVRDFFAILWTKILLPAVGIRLLTDAASFLFRWKGTVPGAAACLAAEGVCLALIFYVVKQKLDIPAETPSRTRRFALAGGLLMLFAMLIVSVRQFAIAGDAMDHMQAKYVDPSLFCDVSNLDFQLELLALLYSVILWITLFIGFGLFAPSEDAFAARRRGTVVFARCFSAVLLTLVLAGAKFCILPHGSLSAVDTTSLQVIAHTQSRDIEASDATVSLLRKTGYRAEKPVYQSTTVTLSYGNTGLLTFRRTVNAGNGALHRLEIPEVEAAYRYDYDAIAYVRHGTAFALESDRIADYPYEDACLIAVCENLIQRQCFQALEFSYPYLLKYDRDFLLSYLETLRDDAMRDRYYAYNPEIRPEYIKQFLDEIS